MTKNSINVVVAGATGYVGLDLSIFIIKTSKCKIKIYVLKKILEKKLINLIKELKKNFQKYQKLIVLNWKKLIYFFYHYLMEKHKN